MLAAAAFAVGGLALAGIDVSVATAPLLPPEPASLLVPPPSVPARPGPAQDPTPVRLNAEVLDSSHLNFLEEPPRRYTADEVRLIAALGGWPAPLLDEVVEVAWCESRNNPLSQNGQILGIMQVHTLWFDYGGLDVAKWSDPVLNMRAAWVAYQYDLARGYEPWTQWQCRPGGRYIPASEFAPPLPTPTVETPAEVASEQGSDEPVLPTPTPAPWELKPLWPPPIKSSGLTPAPQATPAAGGSTPQASVVVQSPSVP